MDAFKYFPRRAEGDALDCAPIVHQQLLQYPEKVFCTLEGGRTWTFGQIAAQVGELQAELEQRGIRAGDRVGVLMANGTPHVALIFALMLSRVVWVPVNTRLKEAGLRHIVEHSQPRLLVVDADFRELAACVSESTAVVAADELFATPDSGHATPRLLPGQPDDTVSLIYTSGTSGAPKGVVFTHRMLRAAAEATIVVADAKPGDRMLFWEPLCHIGGAQLLLLPFLMELQFHLVSKFSARNFWSDLAAARATHVHYLGGILDMLAPQAKDMSALTDLRVFWGAGATPSAWHFIFETFGIRLRECYGMTECSSFATVNDAGTPMSIGEPLPWIGLRLLNEAGHEVPPGETGEIVLSSHVEGVFTRGYLDDPAATASALRNGALHTGDMAKRDNQGSLRFIGRRSDSMRVRGENVSAWEVERVFASHPDIETSAAVGVKSPLGEQDILLYVKAKPRRSLDLAALRAWSQPLLASYQVPRYYQQIDEFVTTPSERIRKQFLSRDTAHALDSLAVSEQLGNP